MVHITLNAVHYGADYSESSALWFRLLWKQCTIVQIDIGEVHYGSYYSESSALWFRWLWKQYTTVQIYLREVHYSSDYSGNSTSDLSLFYLGEGERAEQNSPAKRAWRSELMSELCRGMSKQTNKWPTCCALISGVFRSSCLGRVMSHDESSVF